MTANYTLVPKSYTFHQPMPIQSTAIWPCESLIIERGVKAWAIIFHSLCLNKETLRFDREPHPLERTDEWLATHRFDSAEQAAEFICNNQDEVERKLEEKHENCI